MKIAQREQVALQVQLLEICYRAAERIQSKVGRIAVVAHQIRKHARQSRAILALRMPCVCVEQLRKAHTCDVSRPELIILVPGSERAPHCDARALPEPRLERFGQATPGVHDLVRAVSA